MSCGVWHTPGNAGSVIDMSNGIPAEAFDFYDHLAADNTREFWNAHKAEYEQYVRQPLQELFGVVDHDLFLLLDAEQFHQPGVVGYLDRLQVAGEGMAPPVGSVAFRPVDRLGRLR